MNTENNLKKVCVSKNYLRYLQYQNINNLKILHYELH